jgi:hypothetical protein
MKQYQGKSRREV